MHTGQRGAAVAVVRNCHVVPGDKRHACCPAPGPGRREVGAPDIAGLGPSVACIAVGREEPRDDKGAAVVGAGLMESDTHAVCQERGGPCGFGDFRPDHVDGDPVPLPNDPGDAWEQGEGGKERWGGVINGKAVTKLRHAYMWDSASLFVIDIKVTGVGSAGRGARGSAAECPPYLGRRKRKN